MTSSFATSFSSQPKFFTQVVLAGVLTIVLLHSSSAQSAEQPRRPNVLLILTDDQGFGDIASHGNPHLQTPELDELAEAGARFDRFYVSPVCAPTRASLLTGRYHLRTGVHGVTRGYENLRSDEVTIAEVFQGAGYQTACFGKWHNGRHMPLHPNGQGFETFVGFCGGHWNTYFNPPLERNGEPLQVQGYIADIFTNHALQFMQQESRKPWFCYLAYNTPHSPWRVPDTYWNRYDGLGLDTKAQCAYAMVDNIDWNVGRLLDALRQQGQLDDTIVLFLTDNGANSPRFNAGMKGRKGSVDEGGTRVPLFMRYPKLIAPGTVVKPLTFHLDLLPTLAEMCGIVLDPQHAQSLDGQSFVRLLTGNRPEDWPERMYFTENFRGETTVDSMKSAVRTERWRAVKAQGEWQLYDMHADPGQKQNIASQHPEVTQKLSDAFDDWFADVHPHEFEFPRIPVGHASRTHFDIPAHEAQLVPEYGEQIQYTGDTTNGFANAWITNWTSTNAYPEWKLKVLRAGTYAVSLRYCCRAEDVGCQVSVNAGDQSLLVNVPRAHDPPLLPKPDHLYSNNYQDKASWAELDCGTLKLSEGECSLSVKLTEIARERGIELKSVLLTYVAQNSTTQP